MKRSLNSLIGYAMGATDGEIGTVKEFYFDDETWTIRYLIVETGNWLRGRKVLISTQNLLQPDWDNGIFPVNLTKEKIKHSPDIDAERPVSRQQEIKLQNYYMHTIYWSGGFYAGGMAVPAQELLLNNKDYTTVQKTDANSHLRSSTKVTGYSIKATDGEIGKVEDFLLHDTTWKIDFMVVDTGHWLPGKKVLISPKWMKEIDWENSEITIHASIKQVKNSPEYDPSQTFTESHEVRLHNYYGQFITHVQ